MAKGKLQAALAKDGGVSRYISKSEEFESDEDLMQAALESKSREGDDGASRLARANKISALLKQAGFDFFDIRDLTPNEQNSYSIEEGSVESLASLIYETKNTTPLIVRATKNGYQIIDGETVEEVLEYVQYNPKKLVRQLEQWVTKSVKQGKLSLDEGKEFLSNYRSGLYGYTYLE